MAENELRFITISSFAVSLPAPLSLCPMVRLFSIVILHSPSSGFVFNSSELPHMQRYYEWFPHATGSSQPQSS